MSSPATTTKVDVAHYWGFACAATTVFCGVVLLGAGLAKLLRNRIKRVVLDCFNAAAAGMFLAMTVFHVLPETIMNLLGKDFSSGFDLAGYCGILHENIMCI